jgi:Ion channel
MAAIVVLTTIYFLLPLDHSAQWVALTVLLSGLVALVVMVVLQVRSVLSAAFPILRAVESLAVSVPLFLLLFAGTYVAMENLSPHSFSQPLTHTDALYFTVTVFATVGFGDITPTSEVARLVVTGQMIGDLLILGITIRAITGAVQRRRRQ